MRCAIHLAPQRTAGASSQEKLVCTFTQVPFFDCSSWLRTSQSGPKMYLLAQPRECRRGHGQLSGQRKHMSKGVSQATLRYTVPWITQIFILVE